MDEAKNTFLTGGGRRNLTIDMELDLPWVLADRRRIVQVLGNLLSNAARYSHESSYIRVNASLGDDCVEMSGADEGRGVSPDEMPLLERGLTEEFGPDFLAGREVQVLKGDYSMDHLDAWYRTLSGAISQVPGIVYTDLDEGKNRIEIVMYPRRGGREEMEAAIATVDVPRGAIVIDVGCEGKWPRDFGEPPEEAFLQAVEYSLEVVSQVPYGETVEMKLTLRNAGDEPVSFVLGGSPSYDFVVSTADGELVWHWMCAKITILSLGPETLEPGERAGVRRRVGADRQPGRARSLRRLLGTCRLESGPA